MARLVIAGFLGWLVPGAGHLYLRKTAKALILFLCITATFAAGTMMAGGRNLSYYQYPPSFLGQLLCGGPCIAALILTAGNPYDALVGRMIDAGKLYGVVAGLLNLLAITDALGLAMGPSERGEKRC